MHLLIKMKIVVKMCVCMRKGVSDNICGHTLTRDDEEDNMFETAEIAGMVREQTMAVFDDSEDEADNDITAIR
jgi:hypothetical protein